MVHLYHASDSDSDDAEGLEFGNVQLAQSFGQMPIGQHAGAAPALQSAGAGDQQPASLDISSLPDWDPQDARPAASKNGRSASGSGVGPGAAGRDAGGAAPRPHSTPPRSRGMAADRLLNQSDYMRKNSLTPPALPVPPAWLRDRLGGESLTEMYLQGGRLRQPQAEILLPRPRLHAQQQQPLPNGMVHGAASATVHAQPVLPPVLPPPAAPDSMAGAAAHVAAVRAQLVKQVQRHSGGSIASPSGQRGPTALHHELQRFAAQVGHFQNGASCSGFLCTQHQTCFCNVKHIECTAAFSMSSALLLVPICCML